MANVRRSIARVIAKGDTSQSYIHEAAVDRIGALAFSDELGAALFRLRHGEDRAATDGAVFRRALALLTHRVAKKHHQDRGFIKRISDICLREWLMDLCDKCHGRGNKVDLASGRALDPCTKCGGSGMQRHTDQARMRLLSIEKGRYFRAEQFFATAHGCIGDADAQAARDASRHLEHD